MHGVRRIAPLGVALAALALGAASARGDDAKQKLELRGGDKLEGRILCVSARHVVFDGPGGPRFVERSQVLAARETDGAAIDLAARETAATRDVCGLFLEIFNEKLRVNRGESSFEPSALSSEKSGLTNALLRTGDELRTGPWGRAKVLLPKGALLSANRDAVVQFADTGPIVVRGSARFKDGDVNVAIPEGRVTGKSVDVAFDHTRGRTQITCYQGTCEVEGDGWKLDLFKNHTVDVSNGQGDQSPYVAANAANSFPIDLRVADKRLQVQPGQTVCLVVIRSDRERPVEREPAPREDPTPAPRETPTATAPREELTGGVGRVTKATDAFWHIRSASQQWKIAPDKASSVVLRPGDEVATEDARATVELERPQATIDLNKNTSIVLPQDDVFATAAPIKLKRGQVTARAATGSLGLATPAAEVSVQEGEAIVSATSSSAKVRTKEGRSVLRVGRDVTADVPPGLDLAGGVEDGKTKLEASGKGASFVRIASVLNLQLAAQRALECGRSEDGTIWVTLWNNARLELDGSVEASIEEQDGALVATTKSGLRRTLDPGATVKLGREPVAAPPAPRPVELPAPEKPLVETPRQPELTAQNPPPSPSRPGTPQLLGGPPSSTQGPPPPQLVRAGHETKTLSNGAIVTLINWGPLTEKPSSGGLAEVEGPGGSPLILGPSTRLTLKRLRSGDCVVTTEDHRSITWVQGAQTASFTMRLAQDGKLGLDLPDDRALTVEKGASFELELRADGLVHAELVHQTVFVAKGEHLAVSVAGYKSVAADMAKAGQK